MHNGPRKSITNIVLEQTGFLEELFTWTKPLVHLSSPSLKLKQNQTFSLTVEGHSSCKPYPP